MWWRKTGQYQVETHDRKKNKFVFNQDYILLVLVIYFQSL